MGISDTAVRGRFERGRARLESRSLAFSIYLQVYGLLATLIARNFHVIGSRRRLTLAICSEPEIKT